MHRGGVPEGEMGLQFGLTKWAEISFGCPQSLWVSRSGGSALGMGGFVIGVWVKCSKKGSIIQ